MAVAMVTTYPGGSSLGELCSIVDDPLCCSNVVVVCGNTIVEPGLFCTPTRMSLLGHHVAMTGSVLRTGSGAETDLHFILLVEGILPSSNRYAFHGIVGV